jgi:hypothetical protein
MNVVNAIHRIPVIEIAAFEERLKLRCFDSTIISTEK